MKRKVAAFLVLYLAVMMGVVFFGRSSTGNTHIQAGGLYGPEEGLEEIKGNLTISTSQVTLQNTGITGNLYLSSPGGEHGEVILKNVDVSGSLVVMGAVGRIVLQNSGVKAFHINAGGGHLQVQAEGDSHIGPTWLEAEATLKEDKLSEGAKGFTSVRIAASKVSLSGFFDSVHVEGDSCQLTLLTGRVDLLEVTGQVSSAAILNLSAKTRVDSLLLNGPAHIRDTGFISKALINIHGTTFQQAPEEIHLAPLVIAVISGEEMVGEIAEGGEEENETEEDSGKRPERPKNFLANYDAALKRVTLTWESGDEKLTDRYLLTRQQGQSRESILSSTRSRTYNDASINPGHTYTYYLVAVSPDGYFSHRVQARVSIPGQEPKMFTLTISINPQNSGSVTGAGEYSDGTSVIVTAKAFEGFEFSHWEDQAGTLIDSTVSTTILMDSTKEISAFFMEIPEAPPPDEDDDPGPNP